MDSVLIWTVAVAAAVVLFVGPNALEHQDVLPFPGESLRYLGPPAGLQETAAASLEESSVDGHLRGER